MSRFMLCSLSTSLVSRLHLGPIQIKLTIRTDKHNNTDHLAPSSPTPHPTHPLKRRIGRRNYSYRPVTSYSDIAKPPSFNWTFFENFQKKGIASLFVSSKAVKMVFVSIILSCWLMFLLMLIRGGVKKVVGHFVVGTTFFLTPPLMK